MANEHLVYIDKHNLLGSNFYWHHRQGLGEEDLLAAELLDDRVRVHKDIIEPLISIDAEFKKRGFQLYIKEGYRSKGLYEIVYKRRVESFGKEETDRVLNMKDMPHSTGKSVDVSLINIKTNEPVEMKNKADGTDAWFVGFYRNKEDLQSKIYQELQDMVFDIMTKHDFELGTKNEYFHFNYKK